MSIKGPGAKNAPYSRGLFFHIFLEVNTKCNRKCPYCPNCFLTPDEDTEQLMPEQIFHKVLFDLMEMDYGGIISYHFFNEPLLHPHLKRLVRQAKQSLPKAYQLLFTNGDFLSDSSHDELVQAGIDHFLVTRHSKKPLKARYKQIVLFPEDIQHEFNNRGGVLSTLQHTSQVPCFTPSEVMVITCEGDAVLCCSDYHKEAIMGNVLDSSLWDIWHSEKYTLAAELLSTGARAAVHDICKRCDDTGSQTPAKALTRFMNFIGEDERTCQRIRYWYNGHSLGMAEILEEGCCL